jgi:hypothetical protein
VAWADDEDRLTDMAIDWSNEDFTRLYKRETDDDLLLTWEAEAVWHKFLKKCDKSGIIETRRGVRGLSALLRIPLEVIERVLQELIEDGRIRSLPNRGFIAPNYVKANYVARSVAARKQHSRLTIRNGQHGAGVVSGENDDSESRDVTDCHDESQNHQSINQSINQSLRASRGRAVIPSDWQPRDREAELARSLGLDLDSEAREFLAYWQGDGRAKADWDQTFASRLQAQGKQRRPRQAEPTEVKDL